MLGGKVGFIGAWERERMESILYLAKHGVQVKVYGNRKWNCCKDKYENLTIIEGGLFDDDYVKAIDSFDINLCFLRKINEDQHTTRSIEIPACGGFMIAERTKEHKELFKENIEAVFFSNNEELLEKCLFYLNNERERNVIKKNGRQRCINSGYSNYETLKNILKKIENYDT